MAGRHHDTRVELNDLEEEEAKIMRELREIDEKQHAELEEKRRRDESLKHDPEAALAALLLECEKEVRDAKGYIDDEGPPLKIVRVRHGETAPKGATYLSRPRGTGVDFTVPVTIKAYTDMIKKPIFLNQIRDKIKARAYPSSEDYLDDMRLLARNTAAFNKGADLSWVVQHARFLLEAAEDAVTTRHRFFYDVEDALRHLNVSKQKSNTSAASGAVGKRKRSSATALDNTNGDAKGIPSVGTSIEVYWPNYRRWFLAVITERSGSNVHVVYDEDSTDQWVNLEQGVRWRMRTPRAAAASAATSARNRRHTDAPAAKRRKGGTGTAQVSSPPVVVAGGISPDDLDAFKIELFSKMDDLRESVLDQVKGHLDRIDRIVLRSDILQRVLLAVQDSQMSMEAKMASVEERCAVLQQKLDGVSRPNQDLVTKELSELGLDREAGGKPAIQADTEADDQRGGSTPTERQSAPTKQAIQGEVIEIDDSPEKPSASGDAEAPKDTEMVMSDPVSEPPNAPLAEGKRVDMPADDTDVVMRDAGARPGNEILPSSESRPGAGERPDAQVGPNAEVRPDSEVHQDEGERAGVEVAIVAKVRSEAELRPVAEGRPDTEDGKGEGVQAQGDDTEDKAATSNRTDLAANVPLAQRSEVADNNKEVLVAAAPAKADSKPALEEGKDEVKASKKAADEEEDSSEDSDESEDSDGSDSDSSSNRDEPKVSGKVKQGDVDGAEGKERNGPPRISFVEAKGSHTPQDKPEEKVSESDKGGADQARPRRELSDQAVGSVDKVVIDISSDGGPSLKGNGAEKDKNMGEGDGMLERKKDSLVSGPEAASEVP